MRSKKALMIMTVALVVLTISFSVSARKKTKVGEPALSSEMKTIALGDVDAGYSMSGQKPYQVKESIQVLVKNELEKIGKGRYNVKITSPAVTVKGAKAPEANMPTLPQGKIPTQADMAKYMAQMQQWQRQMSGEVKVWEPVAADAAVEFRVSTSKGGADVGGAASMIGSYTGLDTSIADMSTKSSKMYLTCTLRDPATGTLIDQYTAKGSSVKVRNLAGYTSYDYGDDEITRQRLFERAAKKCAKWIAEQVK